MINTRMTLLATAFAAAFSAAPAQAFEAGDFIVRLGAARVTPNDDADCFNGPATGALGLSCIRPGVNNDNELGLTLEYMLTNSLGVQLLGSTPFNHDIVAELDGSNAGVVAKTKHLPPTLTLNYHMNTNGTVSPFVGAGVNYTWFFDENTTGVLDTLGIDDINLSDSWGLAGVAGFDMQLADDYLFSMQLYYIKISTEAHVGGGVGNSDVDVDPWAFFVGVGKKF